MDDMAEEVFVGTTDMDARAEWLNFDSFLIELGFLYAVTKVNQFSRSEFSLRKGQRVILPRLIIFNVLALWIVRAALVQARQFQSIGLPKYYFGVRVT